MKPIQIHWATTEEQHLKMGFTLGNLYNLISLITIFIGYIKHVKGDISFPQVKRILIHSLDKVESLSSQKTYEFEVSLLKSKLIMKSFDIENNQYLRCEKLIFEVDM
jgi:hypothetical protein